MRFIKCLTITAVSLAVICVSGTVALGLVVDSKSSEILRKIQSRVPGLELKNESVDRGFFTNKGRLYVNYKGVNLEWLSKEGIYFAIDYENYLGFLGLSGKFNLVKGFGNLHLLYDSFVRELPQVQGNYSASVFEGGASAKTSVDGFDLPLEDGKCKISPTKLDFSIDASLKAKLNAKLSKIECGSELLYHGQRAYSLDFQDLLLQVKPKLSGSKLSDVEVKATAHKLSAEASTIYMIGFKPDEHVRDPSLRDAFLFEDPEINLKVEPTGKGNLSSISAKIGGNYSLGMPYVRDGVVQSMQSIHNLQAEAKLKSADLVALGKILSSGDLKALRNSRGVFSNNLEFDLEQLSFNKDGGSFSLKGKALTSYNQGKFENSKAQFKGNAGKFMVDQFVANGYQNTLQNLVDKGYILQGASEYSVDLNYDHNQLYLNGQALVDDSTPDDPDAEQLIEIN